MSSATHRLPSRPAAAVLAILLAVLAVCPARAQEADTAIFLQGVAPRSFDPARATVFEEAEVIDHLYSGLVRFADDALDIRPDLAASWEVSADGLTYVFSLREGARFHDGSPVSAADAAATFNRLLALGQGSSREDLAALALALVHVRQVEVLDGLRLRFSLSAPDASFLSGLASPGAKVVNPRAFEAAAGDLTALDAGSGPYRLSAPVSGGNVVLERFADYFGPRPAIGRLIFRTVADRQARLAEFLAGRANALTGLDAQDAKRLSLLSGATLTVRPGLSTSFLALNVRRPPCSDPTVRKAVRLALNRPNLVGLVYQDLALPAVGLLPPGVLGFGADLPADAYDTAQARQLLEAAGRGQGVGLDFLVLDTTRPYMPRPRELARAIRENLRAAGMDARLQLLELPAFLAAARAGSYDLCLAGWSGDNGDPDNFFGTLFQPPGQPGAYNLSGLDDPGLRALLDEARKERVPERRAALYRQAERVVHDLVPLIPLAHPQFVLATRGGITGVVLNPTGLIRFQGAAFAP